MPGGRYALLIATGRYDHPDLRRLRSPAQDAQGLARVLRDPRIGDFDVRTVFDLRAQVPVRLPDGTDGLQVVRFVGADGPRWLLRGVISGQGAVQPQAAGVLEQIFRDTVVVRGEGPIAPRDPIVLKLPDDAVMVSEGPAD